MDELAMAEMHNVALRIDRDLDDMLADARHTVHEAYARYVLGVDTDAVARQYADYRDAWDFYFTYAWAYGLYHEHDTHVVLYTGEEIREEMQRCVGTRRAALANGLHKWEDAERLARA